MVNEALTLIKTRGHFQVSIHPERHQPNRFKLAELYETIRKHGVRFRGWDFPHIDKRETIRYLLDSIQQETLWEHHLESWAMFQSGHFVCVRGYGQDWRDRSSLWPAKENWTYGSDLNVIETFYRFVEVFEFASRLTFFLDPEEKITVAIVDRGLENRHLVTDDLTYLDRIGGGTAHISEFPQSMDLTKTALFADPLTPAIEAAQRLYERFGRDVSADLLRDSLQKLRRR